MKLNRIFTILISALLLSAVVGLSGCQQPDTLTTGVLPTGIPPTEAPSTVDISLYCVEVDENYAVISNGYFTLKGFIEDSESNSSHFHLDTLQIMDLTANTKYDYSFIVQVVAFNDPTQFGFIHFTDFVGFIYFDQQRSVHLEMDVSQEWVFIQVDARTFVATADKSDLTPDTMRQKYSKITGFE